MTDIKQINEEDLNQVTGGKSNENIYRLKCKTVVNKYDTENYIGQNLYFYCDYVVSNGRGEYSAHKWIYGTLNSSYEKETDCGTKRTANVTAIDAGGDGGRVGNQDICLDNWTAMRE